ncbi:hypothetical protein PCYB_007510 [Plasmodium cynomolgi strain B]|uniref:CYIR protein n=1 Tax=Plasmodium cynomolgi (strain B) TaxID=1120755 RepID=K6VKQ1_PLACD|nr:hypothetical protein PCYB_007510 [Plasmodium cynomolgi strain B]GAB70002.1 hypothetical protein PCYB_007510 [Plasmodium cynomolgi strain B]
MTKDVFDINKWKTEYPFLEKVWELYEKFDKTVDTTKVYSKNYESVCNSIVKNHVEGNDSHQNFCKKLVRNLGCYTYENEAYNPRKEDCIILYYWIYNSVKEYIINENLITQVFYDNYSRWCTYKRKVNCFYHNYYDNFEDPVNMLFMDIFHNNIDIVKQELVKSNDQNYNGDLQKYICKVIHIYNNMIERYCLKDHDKGEKRKNTCSMLGIVRYTYDLFLRGELYNNKLIVPYIEDIKEAYSDTCMDPESNKNKVVAEPKRKRKKKFFRGCP